LSCWGRRRPRRLYSIIQHHLGSLQGPPLHKNCFMLSLHENKFFGFKWEWPCCCQLPTGASLTPWRSGWTGARLDEHGAWRRAVVRRLHFGAGTGPPCLMAEVDACLQQPKERPALGVGEGDGHPSGSGLHLERKPRADVVPPQGASGGCLRENLEPTLRCRKVTGRRCFPRAPPRRL